MNNFFTCLGLLLFGGLSLAHADSLVVCSSADQRIKIEVPSDVVWGSGEFSGLTNGKTRILVDGQQASIIDDKCTHSFFPKTETAIYKVTVGKVNSDGRPTRYDIEDEVICHLY